MSIKRYVVVTTDKRGVFSGYLELETQEFVELIEARMIVKWSEETRGVLGLAAHGPQDGSRVTPSVPKIKLFGITSIVDCSEKAKKKLEAGIWS